MSAENGSGLIEIRAIDRRDVDEGRLVMRCWPESPAQIEALFSAQGTLGMAAWAGETCVGLLHGYRLTLPEGRAPTWPEWNDWWRPRRQRLVAALGDRGVTGPIWCLACCHVGRTLATADEGQGGIRAGLDPRYLGQGIGTMLLHATVIWAQHNSYAAVLGMGAPADLFEFALWSGHLPHTTYARQGFEPLSAPSPDAELPAWARGEAPPEVLAEARRALDAGRRPAAFHERVMWLDTRGCGPYPLPLR